MMQKTLPAKYGVIDSDTERMNSKYGRILKKKQKANNLIGHLNNIFHFKNRKESDLEKVMITNYDQDGKKVPFKSYDAIDDPDLVYVLPTQKGLKEENL